MKAIKFESDLPFTAIHCFKSKRAHFETPSSLLVPLFSFYHLSGSQKCVDSRITHITFRFSGLIWMNCQNPKSSKIIKNISKYLSSFQSYKIRIGPPIHSHTLLQIKTRTFWNTLEPPSASILILSSPRITKVRRL